MQPSAKVAYLFRRGRLARAAQQSHLELMVEMLGIDEQQVIRDYGKPDLLPEPESVVYLIGGSFSPDHGEPVKIGYTRNIPNRLETLQMGSVAKLWLLSYLVGGRELEQEIHRRLSHCRIREDWFASCDDVRREFGLPVRSAA